ncbi:right-handed parallel beta-helix repeat-containing protein [Bradyrhizobium sp. RT10b]|uniref:right-handed parallel beta-helix repeat-containing protein n=1 Tax=Bradyrhizobium sp. RT10b TaxID=3156331 RepID=UPI0033935834
MGTTCSRTAPCKTFAGAISKTAAFGEINCLDSGRLRRPDDHQVDHRELRLHPRIRTGRGTNGIVINAAAADKVTLRGIQLQGRADTASPGLNGVRILSAKTVSIVNCVITQFSQAGISDVRTAGNTLLFVRNTIISNNTGNAISLTATASNKAIIEDSSLINGVASGLGVGNLNNAYVTRTVIAGNASSGIVNDGGSAINVDSSSITSNGTGITANGVIRLSNSDVTLNSTGFSGAVTTYGNNRTLGNTLLGTAPTAAGGAVNNLGEQ